MDSAAEDPVRLIRLEGSDSFASLRINLPAAFAMQDERLAQRRPTSVRRSRLRNAAARGAVGVERRLGLREALVTSGVRRAWFDEFSAYWTDVLGGRSLTVADFHGLRFMYRLRAQNTQELDWSSSDRHLANWATPENLAATFQFVYGYSLRPLWLRPLAGLLPRHGRVLEYGCSLAPMYRAWRTYYSHIPCRWVLADIPTFPFHYSRHVYANDAEVDFHVIRDLNDPLADVDEGFDLIIVQEVFEHLDAPRRIAQYLLDRLNPGGVFAFDYIEKSEALGHDTPAGVVQRIETLEYLASELDVVSGRLDVGPSTVSLCAGRRRPKSGVDRGRNS